MSISISTARVQNKTYRIFSKEDLSKCIKDSGLTEKEFIHSLSTGRSVFKKSTTRSKGRKTHRYITINYKNDNFPIPFSIAEIAKEYKTSNNVIYETKSRSLKKVRKCILDNLDKRDISKLSLEERKKISQTKKVYKKRNEGR